MLLTRSLPSTSTAVPGARRPAGSAPWRHLDLSLFLAAAAISALGVVMVYATTRFSLAAAGASPTGEMKKELIFTFVGVAAFVATVAFDYKRFLSWAPALYVASLLMLLATFAIGRRTLGATSWIQIGSFQFEPSEVAKLTLVLSLAGLLARRKGDLSGRALLSVLGLAAIPFLLIFKQNALGSALVLAVMLVGMLLMAGTKSRHMVVLAVVAVVGIYGVFTSGLLKPYQVSRITAFITAPAGVSPGGPAAQSSWAATVQYNLDQSKTAIADGGIYGKGLFNGSLTNLSYVPNQSTDFIFTSVAEQFGFAGSALLLGLFLFVLWRTWRAALRSRDLAGTLICVGIMAMITFQVFENVGMTLGIMPVAGITLPFMSYGGSSMVVDWVAIGLVVNVGMRRLI
ncbi:MAG TPA: FtsW/RodA/SpoVE family cell cycle protein [Acidimicrobiales bacterium]|nr:FtsW/RodA/SpoVE family cell cycle protein [Acidimicrobiales bacterium]